jgi:hypothetical protein
LLWVLRADGRDVKTSDPIVDSMLAVSSTAHMFAELARPAIFGAPLQKGRTLMDPTLPYTTLHYPHNRV